MADLQVIRTPDIQFSGFYFPELVNAIRSYNRVYAPEITNEDFREVFIQLERAFALMAHLNNVLLDYIANEMYLDSARLPESVKLLLALIDYRLLPASPAQLDMLGELNRTFTSSTRLLESNRKFATARTSEIAEVVFENTSAFDLANRSDQITEFFGVQLEHEGTCDVSSVEPDIVEWKTGVAGYHFLTADLNKFMEVTGSSLGNEQDDVRIIELLDETAPGSGIWNKARLEGASFVSESGLTWKIRVQTVNGAPTIVPVGAFDPFPGGTAKIGDKIYFGHSDVMFVQFDVVLDSVSDGYLATWEFYDPSDTTFNPDTVEKDPTPLTGVLRFGVASLFGAREHTGAFVKIMYIPTGFEYTGRVSYGTSNYVDVQGYMGQTDPSEVITDYLIFADWRPISIIQDGTKYLTDITWSQDGTIKFNLPQSQDDNWSKFILYDKDASEEREAYFLRYRIVKEAATQHPIPEELYIHNGKQYVLVPLVQGKTVEDNPLGSSSGEADQSFTLTQIPYIYDSVRVFVDEGGGDIEWTKVDTFLTSKSFERHFIADIQTDGTAIIRFGDGSNGKVPPIGTNNIRAIYRVGGDENGNIGANKLVVNRDGSNVFRSIINPRSGKYWIEADWYSQESLERVKEAGPLNLRTMYRAVTVTDVETLAKKFTNIDGVRPVARAKAYEESFGPKTVELIVVGQGGAALSQAYKDELEEFFNGGDDYDGVLIFNYELTVTNYIPRNISVSLEITAREVVTEAIVVQTLSALLSPSALESNQVDYVWRFGQEVPLSRISAEIFQISPGNVFKVDFQSPSEDVQLGNRELPVFDIGNSVIVIVPPEFI